MYSRMTDRGFIIHVLVLFESKHHHLSNNTCSDHWFLIYLMTLVRFFLYNMIGLCMMNRRAQQGHHLLYSNTHT